MPFSKAALVSGPGPSICHAISPGPQLLEHMSILSSLCTKAADSVASVDLFLPSKMRMPYTREYGFKFRCLPHERSIIQIQKHRKRFTELLAPFDSILSISAGSKTSRVQNFVYKFTFYLSLTWGISGDVSQTIFSKFPNPTSNTKKIFA